MTTKGILAKLRKVKGAQHACQGGRNLAVVNGYSMTWTDQGGTAVGLVIRSGDHHEHPDGDAEGGYYPKTMKEAINYMTGKK